MVGAVGLVVVVDCPLDGGVAQVHDEYLGAVIKPEGMSVNTVTECTGARGSDTA